MGSARYCEADRKDRTRMNTTNETDRRTARQRKAQDHVPRPAGTKGIGRPQEYTGEQVEAALRATFGNLTAAATALKFERGTLYTYLERYPHLKEIRPAKRRELVEIAEVPFEKRVGRLKVCGSPVRYGAGNRSSGMAGGKSSTASLARHHIVKTGRIGGLLPASPDRAGRFFDGWLPIAPDADQWARLWNEVKEIARTTVCTGWYLPLLRFAGDHERHLETVAALRSKLVC
jgi:hypothetical protein